MLDARYRECGLGLNESADLVSLGLHFCLCSNEIVRILHVLDCWHECAPNSASGVDQIMDLVSPLSLGGEAPRASRKVRSEAWCIRLTFSLPSQEFAERSFEAVDIKFSTTVWRALARVRGGLKCGYR